MRSCSRTNWATALTASRTSFLPALGRVLFAVLGGIILSGSSELAGEVRGQLPEKDSHRAALEVRFELAANFASGEERQRNEVLAMLDERSNASDKEATVTRSAFKVTSDSKYRSLAPAETATASAYILALRKSYARYLGALSFGDKDWAAKQLNAAQEYAKLASDALLAESRQDDQDVARLQMMPFAVRRSSAEQNAFVDELKKSGLGAELRNLLQVSGLSGTEITAFHQQVLKLSPGKLGVSPLEMLSYISASRQELAAGLIDFYQASPGATSRRSTQSFVVGNPRDKEETIDLFIRPVSIPPNWKLSVMDAEEQPKFKVREVEQGKHYAVTLPAKAQVRVTSVVVPVGEVGTNTTARWAVEGKIDNELIGGMVHEMNVPYIVADLELPPVGSQEVEEELPAPPKAWARVAAEVAAVVIILGLLTYFFLFWRRRHHTGTSSLV